MKATVQKSDFGRVKGNAAALYTLTNANGLVAKITNYGTIITALHVPGRSGKLGDIVLGFDNVDQYLRGHPYFGCTVGRVANRIAKGQFTLNGKTYKLAVNNGPNSLHGGIVGFDKVLWAAEPQEDDGAGVRFSYTSADGEEGYPGKVDVVVLMTLTNSNELRIDYTAKTDAPTPLNLTNHSYFNLLAGPGDVLGHELMLSANYYTPADPTSIPTGEIKPVKGTPMDFTTPHTIGERIEKVRGEKIGYDHNYVVTGGGKGMLVLVGRAYEPQTGRVVEVHTTQPGVQFYTGNYLDGSLRGKYGRVYAQHTGFCLETQHFPDSVNHPGFPSTILNPGEVYRQTTVHRFTTL
jgi:aldose 1-epimerase